MNKQVVAVLKDPDKKDGVYRELELKGVSRENIELIHKEDKEASPFSGYFEQGDYVVVVESDKEIGHIPVEDEDLIDEHRTPKGHHHMPHHQMKQGL
ncbi:hypothetical protein [Alkalicoccus saliphilus]|jgi:hypothetical protein|uniref:Uncharacterized protein n=1 Tax=Alkalicoccus saliphilus TaxID=200989 RepID=A0A2T4U6Z9_9BACI|nr:hypothetical protein [Alkalicoccus saliphilus]PTL39183.1 hypothetical protein C6Y45_07260 [Alkalicoccus saliphilus]